MRQGEEQPLAPEQVGRTAAEQQEQATIIQATQLRETFEASPFGKIPGFRDGDFAISDSSAIIHYLEAVKPEPNLIPKDPKAGARAIWYDEFSDTILVACGGKIVFNRFVGPKLMGVPGDEAAAMTRMAQADLAQRIARLEAIEADLKVLLVPRDPNDSRNVFLEIRAGTGGEEAALFAAQLFRMYQRYAALRGWRVEVDSVTRRPAAAWRTHSVPRTLTRK